MAHPTDNASSTPPSPPSGPMTRSRAKAIHDKVNSFLYMCYLDPTLDGTLPHAKALCILRYNPRALLHGRMEDGQEDGREEEGEEEAEESASAVLPPSPAVLPPRSSAGGTTVDATGAPPLTPVPTRGIASGSGPVLGR